MIVPSLPRPGVQDRTRFLSPLVVTVKPVGAEGGVKLLRLEAMRLKLSKTAVRGVAPLLKVAFMIPICTGRLLKSSRVFVSLRAQASRAVSRSYAQHGSL